ncbi:hypothetical protein Tco_0642756 [Tanacetum coccineum]
MSLEESDDLNISEVGPIDPALEACSLPKFDMHLYKSSLTETHVKWLVKLYGIPKDLYLWVAPEGMTMDALPNGLSNVWMHPGHAFSLKDSKGKVITVAEFLRLPNFQGCKVSAGALLPPGSARVTHLATPAGHLKDIPPKIRDMVTVEIPCRKVLDDKAKKKRKADEKAMAHAADADIQADKVVMKRGASKDVRKRKRVHVGAPVQQVLEHVSSPTPLNHAKPLETLANIEHVSPNASAGRMGALRNQTNKHAPSPPLVNVGVFVTGERVLRKMLMLLLPMRAMVIMRVGSLACRLSLAPLGMQDMMSNLFTPADLEFFNEGVQNESAIKRSWKLLCQSAQQQANTLLRFEALTEEHVNLVYAHESCKDVKSRYKEFKKELASVQTAYDEKTSAYDQLSKNYDGALTREKSLQERVEELEKEKKNGEQLSTKQAERIENIKEALRQSEADAHQLRLDREKAMSTSGRWAFSLAIGKGFIDGVSIGYTDPDIQAILKATPIVNPTFSDIFMNRYEKLFDKRYPYVNKVDRMYLLDPSGLQNIMLDETGPTPGGGPRDTPTASYA